MPRALARAARKGCLDFGLFFFAAEHDGQDRPYSTLLEAARRVDGHLRFISVPERHYHRFGGIYPAPALALGALAAITTNVELRFGSLIAPLHGVVEMVEWYSMLQELSSGRIGIAFGSGWHRRDFLLCPERHERRRTLLFEAIAEFQALVRQGTTSVGVPAGLGEVELHPRTRWTSPRIWITSSGNPETFREAGARGFNLLTHLETSDWAALTGNIAAYREARAAAGHDPRAGLVTLMMHTFVSDEPARVRRAVDGLKAYLDVAMDLEASSARLTGRMSGGRRASEGELVGAETRAQVINLAVEKYLSGAALIGSRASCSRAARDAAAAGVDEIACLVDFLSDPELIASGLPGLINLADEHSAARKARDKAAKIAELFGAEESLR